MERTTSLEIAKQFNDDFTTINKVFDTMYNKFTNFVISFFKETKKKSFSFNERPIFVEEMNGQFIEISKIIFNETKNEIVLEKKITSSLDTEQYEMFDLINTIASDISTLSSLKYYDVLYVIVSRLKFFLENKVKM